jgi:peptidoglycan hydrolase-like protein with peptidoglycan-binding domain
VPILWVATTCIALGIGVVAGRTAFSPPSIDTPAPKTPTFTVSEATVGASITLGVSARWPTQPIPLGGASGTITSIALNPGMKVNTGDEILTINLRPVHVGEGTVPSFRVLEEGVSGSDVRQLQQFLKDTGAHWTEPSGKFDKWTTESVKYWQETHGLEQTGIIEPTDIIYVPQLPARFTLSDEITIGATITAGQNVLNLVESSPTFTADVGGLQSSVIPTTGQEVFIDSPSGTHTWTGVVMGSTDDGMGGISLALGTPDGAALCGKQCAAEIPVTPADTILTGRVVTIPEVEGPAVPPASIGTSADGSRFVVGLDGTRIPVVVRATDGTRTVVSGVDPGMEIQLFATVPPESLTNGEQGAGTPAADDSVMDPGPNG